jgi:hypothetical protein
LKEELLSWLEQGDFDSIAQAARHQKRILSLLTALTYHPQPLVAWRAVQAMGIAARVISASDPEYVLNHLRRLNWLVNDESGGIGWRAPESIGEILAECPGQFDEFISPIVYFLDMESEDAPRFRMGTLWAIGRIASANPGVIIPILDLSLACLVDTDPQVRGMALHCLHRARYSGEVPGLQDLLADNAEFCLYQESQITISKVAELAALLANRES